VGIERKKKKEIKRKKKERLRTRTSLSLSLSLLFCLETINFSGKLGPGIHPLRKLKRTQGKKKNDNAVIDNDISFDFLCGDRID